MTIKITGKALGVAALLLSTILASAVTSWCVQTGYLECVADVKDQSNEAYRVSNDLYRESQHTDADYQALLNRSDILDAEYRRNIHACR